LTRHWHWHWRCGRAAAYATSAGNLVVISNEGERMSFGSGEMTLRIDVE
jgi:hypothetical protein